MPMSKQLINLVLAFALVFLAACTKKESTEDPEQTLHMTIGASPQSLDPHLISGIPALKVVTALSEPLLSMDNETLDPIPGLADRWEVLDDGLRYRFHIREKAKWSDGSRVTAKDFVFTWSRVLSPKIANLYATDYYTIKGAAEYHQGKVEDFASVGVYAISDQILEFNLVKTDPLFLKRMTQVTLSPVQRAAIEKHGDAYNPVNKWTLPPNYVSNGPFVLKKWELNKILVAEKNPHYWDADKVKLEKIYFYPVENEAAEERMFRGGQIQLAYGSRVPAQKIEGYRETMPDSLFIIPGYGTYFYIFNTQKPPFDNALVRNALALAIDRQTIVNRILKAGEIPATSLTPLDPRYKSETHVKYDPELAKKRLAEAGYPNGEGFPSVTLLYNTADVHRKVAVAIQQMWKTALNIDIALENQEWKVFLQARKEHNFELARSGAISSFGDPADFLDSYASGHGMNDADWRNEKYDKLVKSAAKELDQEKRFSLLKEAEKLLIQEMPLIPLYYYVYSYLKAPEVQGVHFNAVDRPDFKSIYIDSTKAREK